MENSTDAPGPQEADEATPKPLSWLPDGCPPWCGWTDVHKEGDALDDRWHGGSTRSVVMTAADPMSEDAQPTKIQASLVQGYREAEPRIEIDRDGHLFLDREGNRVDLTLTLDEAEAFAHALLDLVDIADPGQDGLS